MAIKKMPQHDGRILLWLLKIAKKQFPIIGLSIIINTAFASCSIWFVLSCREVIDAATSYNRQTFISKSIFLFSIIILQLILRLSKRWLEEHIRAKLEITYKSYIFLSLLQKDYTSLSSYHSGELLNRLFSDVTIISDGIATFLPGLIEMLTLLVGASSVLLRLDTSFTMIFIFGGSILFFLTKIFRKRMKVLHKCVQEKDGKVRSFLQEALGSLLIIKVFDIGNLMKKKSDKLQSDHYKAKMHRTNISILANSGFSFIFQISYFYSLIWGCFNIINKQMSFGTLTALLQLVRQIQQPFANLSGFLPRYYSIIASAERLDELVSLHDETSENIYYNWQDTYSNLKSINLENVTFAFQQNQILSKTSLIINKYDFVAIEGISGIGKSTLLKLLLGVYEISGGNIFIQLNNLTKIPINCDSRKLFSYVPQGNYLFSGTIYENITLLQPDADLNQIESVLQLCCADGFINELHDGLDTVIHEKGAGLSEGQIQRLAIARALLSNSPILLLDEATSALDEKTEIQLLNNLKTLKTLTLIIVTHKKAALAICNKHIKISNQKIICQEKIL